MRTAKQMILPCVVLATAAVLVLALNVSAVAAQPSVDLGTATPSAILAGTTVTNTGPSVISGDVGVSPGSAVTGFPPGLVNAGTIHAADAVALQAKNDLTVAYNDAAGRGPVVDVTSQNLGGMTLVAGVYSAASAMALTGTVTLDAQGDPDAIFIFQAGSTLKTASSSTVALIGGAQACNVFWQVGSSATIGTTSVFVGSVLALTDISLQTGATVQGRMLARNGQVSLDTNTITRPFCAAPPTTGPTPTTDPAPTTGVPPTPTPTTDDPPTPSPTTGVPPSAPVTPTSPNVTPTPTATSLINDGASTLRGSTPIPAGRPDTGRTPEGPGSVRWLWLGLTLLGGATLAAYRGIRRRTAGGRHVL